MKAIRTRLGMDSENDRGLTLIEVIIALMVFGIVAVGVAYSLASILTLSRDSRNRVVAANIAAEFIDNARSIENVFTVVDQNAVVRTVAGVRYFVDVETGWVTSTDSTAQCGAATATGAGALEYKRVNVEVTWEGMRSGTTPIRSDTLLAPNSRINDPTLGTIVVSAITGLGTGSSGITVNVQPQATNPNGAAPVANQGLPTDSDGCSYVLKVVPGNYTVSLTRAGYVDRQQTQTTSSVDVSVAAGGSILAKVSFDNGAVVTTRYPTGALVPTNLQTTFVSTNSGAKVVAGNNNRIFPDVYQLIAGTYDPVNCQSPDPGSWAVRADTAFGERMDSVTLTAGGTATVDVPVGTVSVSAGGLKNKYIYAVPVSNTTNGSPGCPAPVTGNNTALARYTFAAAPADTVVLALPYGSYSLYFSSSSNATSGSSLLGTVLNNLGLPVGAPAAASITLDPRTVH